VSAVFERIAAWLAGAAAAALLAVTMTLVGPAPAAYAVGPHDCRTTARAQDMIDEAEESVGDSFGCINRCPCGRTWVWDGEQWSQSVGGGGVH
jgi:hypothetical protein